MIFVYSFMNFLETILNETDLVNSHLSFIPKSQYLKYISVYTQKIILIKYIQKLTYLPFELVLESF